MRKLAEKTFRTGRQTLWTDGFRFFVSLKNRTNDTLIQIPATKARVWKRLLR